jgi:hypothetical protein
MPLLFSVFAMATSKPFFVLSGCVGVGAPNVGMEGRSFSVVVLKDCELVFACVRFELDCCGTRFLFFFFLLGQF